MLGAVQGMCGTKYAQVLLRVERWSARPVLDDLWEDVDELPFEAVPDGGVLRLHGFDPLEGEGGLVLDGFRMGRVRVRVLARGRHRYHYGDHVDETRPPEEWLMQFFPHPGPADPLAGAPRRLAGMSPFGEGPTTGWGAAVQAWRQTGWDSYLNSSSGYRAIRSGLYTARRPVTRTALAELSAARNFGLSGTLPVVPADSATAAVPSFPGMWIPWAPGAGCRWAPSVRSSTRCGHYSS